MCSLAQVLRDTNHRLGSWLDDLVSSPESPVVAKPEQLTAILSELLKTGAAMRAEPMPQAGTDPDLDAELALYRGYVERLRALLPSIHNQLLLERARLEHGLSRTILQSTPQGFGLYQRMGYRTVTSVAVFCS